MTHLEYIIPSYALAVGIPLWFALAASLRLGSARRRLAAIDPRASRASGR